MKQKIGMLLILLVASISAAGCYTTPQAGQIGVVRNGGPFDNHNIRQLICPGVGLTGNGVHSTTHYYPDDNVQRYYTITADAGRGDRPGVDVVKIPTADGVQVGLEGTFYLTTAFNCSKGGKVLLQKFDDKFGVRTFPVIGSSDSLHPWEGDTGWAAYLDAVVRPVIDSDLRTTVGNFNCAELVASCALIHSNTSGQTNISLLQAGKNSANLQKIQDAINAALSSELKSTLGEEYFTHVQFRIQRVDLPSNVQGAIDEAQSNFAALSSAQAQVTKAKLQNEANAELSKQYAKTPALAQIEMIKNLPAGTNVYFGVQPILTAPAGH